MVIGQGRFGENGTYVSAGQIGHLAHTNICDGSTRFTVTAIEPKFLLWTGQPLHQPVVARGPFVMNTQDEINEAFADYRAGVFGSIPTE